MADQQGERKEMTVREAGRLGGDKRKAALGPEGYRAMGEKGGRTTKERHGAEFYSEIGRKGGETVKERHGEEHYSRTRAQGRRPGTGADPTRQRVGVT